MVRQMCKEGGLVGATAKRMNECDRQLDEQINIDSRSLKEWTSSIMQCDPNTTRREKKRERVGCLD